MSERQDATAAEPEPPGTVELALRLLRLIAEDAALRGSHRVAARRHLGRLARLAAEERRGRRGDGARY